jgi:hypothetical protein
MRIDKVSMDIGEFCESPVKELKIQSEDKE